MNYFIVRESKRVLAIFDELVNDVDALTCLPDDLSSLSSGDDLAYWSQPHMIAIQELIELEKVIRDGTVTSDEVHRHHSLVRNIVDLVRAGDATNDPCRSRDLAAGNSALISFLDTLKIARSTLQRKLSSTAEEERQMLDIVRAAIHREADANADIEAVKRELANEKLTRKQEVQNKDRIIAQLEEELVQLRSNFSVEFDTYQAQVEERDNADAVRYDSEEKTLCETSRTMNSELLALRDKHHKEEAAHRHDRQKKENKVQTVIDVYDAQRTEDTQVIRTANRERREYEELCAKAEKELEELREEHARANLEEETESFRLQHNVEAAASLHTAMRIIQSFYRSYSIRVNLNRKTKGGKKKEKKKK